jgi:PTH2 family peptidyl-tRNA hydrolase
MGLFSKAEDGELKQAILLRKDLRLPAGKAAAQAAHASVDAVLHTSQETVTAWRKGGMKKVVLKVADEKELFARQQAAKRLGLAASVITDAGRTVVEPGTVTALGIGPGKEEDVDKAVGDLPLY